MKGATMPSDPRKRQRKLERRAAKRKDKKHQLVKEASAGIGEQLTAATKYPPLHTWITEDLWTEGIGWALFSRELADKSIATAVFLVDRYCLGVKNIILGVVGRSTYQSKIVRKMWSQSASREVSGATVRKLVEQAVAYAHDLGFQPHADYDKAKRIFGDVNADESTEQFEFGKDGKPYFISGPNETPERCRQIYHILTNRCGPGQFEYLMQIEPAEGRRLMVAADDADDDGDDE
jgi:hypothetical protein